MFNNNNNTGIQDEKIIGLKLRATVASPSESGESRDIEKLTGGSFEMSSISSNRFQSIDRAPLQLIDVTKALNTFFDLKYVDFFLTFVRLVVIFWRCSRSIWCRKSMVVSCTVMYIFLACFYGNLFLDFYFLLMTGPIELTIYFIIYQELYWTRS